ncbi:hypothetical protein ACM9HF_18460 [Colwellia sp. RE-S-Sl-9]
MRNKKINTLLALMFTLMMATFTSPIVLADGMVVDKIYHPYVVANEQSIEWRLMSSQTSADNVLAQRIGYGLSLLEDLAVEYFIIGERDETGNFELQATEIEARWMLTEQGQFWADWGVLFELEKQRSLNIYEATMGLIFEKELNKNSLTLNLFAIKEWGKDIQDEWELEFRAQYRYRYLPELQPSLEIYTGENFVGLGPGFMGVHRFEGQKQLKWEAGFISEVSHKGKNHTLRFAIEYEF